MFVASYSGISPKNFGDLWGRTATRDSPNENLYFRSLQILGCATPSLVLSKLKFWIS